MEKWSFGIDNENLIDLVLSGKKTATSYLFNNNLSKVGEKSVILHDDKTSACEIETVKLCVLKFCEMTQEKAMLEGEGDLSLEYWKKVHFDFFKSIKPNFSESDKIVFEIFKVIKKF